MMLKINLKSDNGTSATLYHHLDDIEMIAHERGLRKVPNDSTGEETLEPVEFLRISLYKTRKVKDPKTKQVLEEPISYFIWDLEDIKTVLDQL